jgi:hypothetical protein
MFIEAKENKILILARCVTSRKVLLFVISLLKSIHTLQPPILLFFLLRLAQGKKNGKE